MSAGPGSIAYKHEPDGDYMGSPTDDTYKLPGKDPTAEDISFENALQRMGVPTTPRRSTRSPRRSRVRSPSPGLRPRRGT